MEEIGQLGLNFSANEKEKRIVVFDLETQLSAEEVGGWGNTHLMRVAVGVAHDSADGEYKVFYEDDMNDLLDLLFSADLVVGFNSKNFDYGVLRAYTEENLAKALPSFDILEEIRKKLGFRVGLNNIAENTLGAKKSADGLQSLQWFREGKLDLIRDYCIQDVKVTRDVFNYGLEKKGLVYLDKKGRKTAFTVDWDLEKFYREK